MTGVFIIYIQMTSRVHSKISKRAVCGSVTWVAWMTNPHSAVNVVNMLLVNGDQGAESESLQVGSS